MKLSTAWRTSAAIAVLATAPLTVTVAEPEPAVDSAAAAFLNRAELRHWLADGERGLWIQVVNLKWFYARFSGVCRGLDSTNSLVFDTRASGNIDRTSAVVVPGRGRCTVQTLAPSGGPPKNRNANVVLQPQTQ
jgi:hypothetical protein